MRACEFITEGKMLPPEEADPMRQTYLIPGLNSSDPYKTYRFGVAMARARSDAVKDDTNPFMLPWTAEEVFGEHAVVSGMSPTIDPIIDQALAMTNIPGGKKLIGTENSQEPGNTDKHSPVKGFAGYPRK